MTACCREGQLLMAWGWDQEWQNLEENRSSDKNTVPGSWSFPTPRVHPALIQQSRRSLQHILPCQGLSIRHRAASNGFGHLSPPQGSWCYCTSHSKETNRQSSNETDIIRLNPHLDLYFTMVYQFCIESLFCRKSLFWKLTKWTKAKLDSLWLLLLLLKQCEKSHSTLTSSQQHPWTKFHTNPGLRLM